MKPILFLDRDGTLIVEPEDEQIDSLEKLTFVPGVFSALSRLVRSANFDLVMVSNQDGLGTESFPESHFWPAHNKMLAAFSGEKICFREVLIDRSFPHENAVTRKPRTGLLEHYLAGDGIPNGSFVIGDRISDMELAANLAIRGILLGRTEMLEKASENVKAACALVSSSWEEVVNFLIAGQRRVCHSRKTGETEVSVDLVLQGSGTHEISTGLKFFDHMLAQLAKHSGIDLKLKTIGDLDVDEHHTIEDTAIALGTAFSLALSDKVGVERYGFCLPMDDSVATTAIDFGGRSWLCWQAEFGREYVGDMPTEMFKHFFKSFADAAHANIFIRAEGENEHHKIESIFKGVARSIRAAVRKDPYSLVLPSTKGML